VRVPYLLTFRAFDEERKKSEEWFRYGGGVTIPHERSGAPFLQRHGPLHRRGDSATDTGCSGAARESLIVGGGAPPKSKVILESKAILEAKITPEVKELLEITGVFRGRELTRKERRLTCGIAPVDRLIGGGIVRGRVSEIIGNPGAGRTSLAAAFAASVTARGEVAAWIDTGGGFDPASIAAAGVDLARMLWVAMPANASTRWERPLNAQRLAGEGPSEKYDSDGFERNESLARDCARQIGPSPAPSPGGGEGPVTHAGRLREAPLDKARYLEKGLRDSLDKERYLDKEQHWEKALRDSVGGHAKHPVSKERYFAEGLRTGRHARRSAGMVVLKAAEWILTAGGFGLVVIDCGGMADFNGRLSAFTQSAALRLAHGAERSGAVVLVIAPKRMCGTFAALSLMLSRNRACFSRASVGAPVLFDGLTVEARVMRNKLGGSGDAAIWSALADPLSASSGVPRSSAAMPESAAARPLNSHDSRNQSNHDGGRAAAR
jgi:hypothetical protein